MPTHLDIIDKKKNDRIQSFDLLKVTAMMYVIFGWHMDDYANDILASLVGRTLVIGVLGIFIFVSGFTLARSCGEIHSTSDVWQYLKRRFVRIYPLYCVALFLSFVTSQITLKQFTAGVFLFNAVLNIPIKTYWFVTMLFIFYLLLPCILYKFSKARALTITFLFIITCALLNNSLLLMDIRLVYYSPLFTWGVLCAKDDALFRFVKTKKMIIISLVMLSFATYFLDPKNGVLTRYFFVTACLVFSVAPLISLSERFAQKTSSRLFFRLSYASFCMYLFHRIIFFALLKIYTPESDSGIVFYLFLAGFPIIYLVSERLQTLYDLILIKTKTDSEQYLMV